MLKRRRGFTLIELLVVVAIVAILAMIVVPNVIVAVHRSKQKTTMKDVITISTAIIDYVADNGTAPPQDGAYDASAAFYSMVSPFYIKVLPFNDKWGYGFRVWTRSDVDGNYGISSASEDDFLVASFARDKIQEDFSFNINDPEDGFFNISRIADFDKDLIMWDGSWIRRPKPMETGKKKKKEKKKK